jgi:3-hydroxyacyl-[acyl-carrier-protein] dehydratase
VESDQASTLDPAAILPHADPFLLVTRVLELQPDGATCEWDVAEDLDIFRGHFPGNPILPGVYISEHCFQSAAIAIYCAATEKSDSTEAMTGTPVLVRIEDARFKRMVRPGETLHTQVEITDALANARWCSAVVRVQGELVARIKFVLALAEETKEETSSP